MHCQSINVLQNVVICMMCMMSQQFIICITKSIAVLYRWESNLKRFLHVTAHLFLCHGG